MIASERDVCCCEVVVHRRNAQVIQFNEVGFDQPHCSFHRISRQLEELDSIPSQVSIKSIVCPERLLVCVGVTG